jgi:enterochelin esterase-like enzyme
LSRGGYWALEIAFRNPQNFQSVGGHSAALLDESAGSEYDPMVTAQKSDIDDLRIYLDAGRNDYVLSPLLEFHEVLIEVDRDHQWILNEGRHEDNYWSSHLKEYLTWYTDPWPPERALYPLCSLDSPDR